MSQFLWIEDFEDGTEHATKNVFGHLLQNADIPTTKPKLKRLLKDYGVLIELSFLEGLRFIRKQLYHVDYVILDIDLIDIRSELRYDEQTDLLELLETFYDYQPNQDKSIDEANYKKAAKQLKPEAGYKLYVELVIALDFPKEHILFCSNHTKEQKHIQSVFKQAKIDLPLTFSKDEKNEVQNWISERRNNPYSVLRRGIIEGCQSIQNHLSNDIPFSQFCSKKNRQNVTAQNMRDYLKTLQSFLPRREPDKNNEAQFDYVTGLFQMFWHDLSPITVKSFTPTQDYRKIFFEYEYDFVLNDYGKDDMDSFLFELARSIYKRSFPVC